MLRLGFVFSLFFVAACGPDSPCGVSWDGAEPELGTMVLSDGTVLTNGSWATTRINAGTLTIDVRAMGNEVTSGDALSGELPVCRVLDDQNDAISYHDLDSRNNPWITNASHTGTLAITEVTDEVIDNQPTRTIKGRFEATIESREDEERTIKGAFYVAESQ